MNPLAHQIPAIVPECARAIAREPLPARAHELTASNVCQPPGGPGLRRRRIRGPEDRGRPAAPQGLKIEARIVGLAAETTLRQTFVNALPETLEAGYIFPLPPSAAVTHFTNGRRVGGTLMGHSPAARVQGLGQRGRLASH